MKSLYFITMAFAMLVIFSCEKDKDPAKTTYQVINNNDRDASEVDPLLDGTLYEVIVFCYDDAGDVIRQDNIDPVDPDGGISDIMEVGPECVKLKLSFKFLPPESDYYSLVDRLYVEAFTLIVKGKNVNIVLNGETMVGDELTSSRHEYLMLNEIKSLFRNVH